MAYGQQSSQGGSATPAGSSGDLQTNNGSGGLGSVSPDANLADTTHAATSKTTPVDADETPLVDSGASNVLKKLTWANFKATLKSYFDSIYATLSGPTFSGTVTLTGSAPEIDADSGDGTFKASGGGKWIMSVVFKLAAAIQDSLGGVGTSGQVLKSNGSGVLTYGDDKGSYLLPLGSTSGNLAASQTAYGGWQWTNNTQVQARYKVRIPKTGTIKTIIFYMYGSGGDAGHNITMDVWLNNTTSVGSVSGPCNVFPTELAATGLSQAVTGNGVSGDYVELRASLPAGATTITSCLFACHIYIETAL